MNQIDKLFKNKLEHYHTDVSPEKWDQIASRLPVHKKPLLSLRVALSLLLIFGVFFTFLMLDHQSLSGTREKKPLMALENVNLKKPELGISGLNKMVTKVPNLTDVPALYSTLRDANVLAQQFNQYKDLSETDMSLSDANIEIYHIQKDDTKAGYTDDNAIGNYGSVPSNKAEQLKSETFDVPQKLKIKELVIVASASKDKPAKACPFVSDYQNKSVDIYFSNDYGAKTLIASSGDFLKYKTIRNETESAQYSFSAGVRFGYNLSYRWNLHTGFNYSQINEKFEYTDPESKQTRVITIKDYIYQNGKIIDSVINEKLVEVPGTSKLKIYNKYRSFDIPVIARYTMYANTHISLSAQAGVYLNLATQQRGVIMDTDSVTPVSINSDQSAESEIFKTQAGISVYGAISVALHLTSSLDFLIEPNVRFQTESMTTGNYPLTQRFNTIGLAAGVRYKF
jgi:hypothetical protein